VLYHANDKCSKTTEFLLQLKWQVFINTLMSLLTSAAAETVFVNNLELLRIIFHLTEAILYHKHRSELHKKRNNLDLISTEENIRTREEVTNGWKENCVMKSFIIRTLHQILLGRLNVTGGI
jgi:hypothetical protein